MTELKPSKSARKREDLALRKQGEELVGLKQGDLDSLSLDEGLLEAVMEARRIKARGALRRQKQYIGKLMRHIDPEPIRTGLAELHR